jgi:hypothetical protein
MYTYVVKQDFKYKYVSHGIYLGTNKCDWLIDLSIAFIF